MRLFFGLSLPGDVRAVTRACAESAALSIPGRYPPAENHHVTLAFLGEVEPARAGEAEAVLAACAAAFPAPQVTIRGPAHFGREENAIFILRAAGEPPLAPLHDALVRTLQERRLPFDPGPFSPHVTLARHARLAGAEPPPFAPVRFCAVQAHLFLSARDAEGVLRYTPLASAPFMTDSPGNRRL